MNVWQYDVSQCLQIIWTAVPHEAVQWRHNNINELKVMLAKNITPWAARYGITVPLKVGIKFSSAYFWNSWFNIFE